MNRHRNVSPQINCASCRKRSWGLGHVDTPQGVIRWWGDAMHSQLCTWATFAWWASPLTATLRHHSTTLHSSLATVDFWGLNKGPEQNEAVNQLMQMRFAIEIRTHQQISSRILTTGSRFLTPKPGKSPRRRTHSVHAKATKNHKSHNLVQYDHKFVDISRTWRKTHENRMACCWLHLATPSVRSHPKTKLASWTSVPLPHARPGGRKVRVSSQFSQPQSSKAV